MMKLDPGRKDDGVRGNRGRNREAFAVVLRVELGTAYLKASGYEPEDPLLAELWRWHRVRQTDLVWMKEALKELKNAKGLLSKRGAEDGD